MVRPKKVIVVAAKSTRVSKEAEEPSDANGSLMVQSRSRRTIKPNPKYNSKEIISLKRHSSDEEDDDDEENGGGDDNTEDDEDFHDDGAKDSDAEDEPQVRKRGRPRIEAPRSEPPPMRKLQQMRAGLKEATMSASKAMQIPSAAALDKKRKLDYDDEAGEPEGKRGRISTVAAATATNTRGATRVVATAGATTGSASEKENAKKNETNNNGPVRILNLEKGLGRSTVGAQNSPGVSTRRQQTVITTSTAVAKPIISTTPKTAVTIRTNSPATATGAPKAAILSKDTTPKSMIQVRRATPMNSSPNDTPPAAVSLPAINKGRVILNRAPMMKTKAQLTPTPVAIKTQSPIKITPTIRALAPRGAQPTVSPNSATPTTAAAAPITTTTSSTPRIQNSVRLPPVKVIAEHTTIVKTASATLTIPKGAEMVQMADGTTARITSLESRFVVRVPPEEEPVKSVAQEEAYVRSSVNLVELRYDIKKLKLPNERWSFQLKLMKLGVTGVFGNVEVPDRPGFGVHSISLNRVQCTSDDENQLPSSMANGRARPKPDRSVELLKDRLTISIDGKMVKLLQAPEEVADTEELETLLEIVDHVEIDDVMVVPCKAVVQL